MTPRRTNQPDLRSPAPDVALLATQELYETTRDICGRLDLEPALQAIVRRARRLLDGDVAYLATCDNAHQVLRMRAFDNVRSESFKALVVPYGVGVGGAVAAQRRAMTSDDYHADAAIVHSPEVDASAVEEGLRSGVGAPVEFESRLLAVLFVAKRTQYTFSPHQVTMLSSLANAAAIAINNAQVHGRLLAAMDIHQSLMDLALADRGPAAVTKTLAGLIGGPVRLVDWRGTFLADVAFEGRSLPPPVVDALPVEGSGTDATTVPIRIAGIVEGFLSASPHPDSDLAAVAIEQSVTVLALELMKLRSAEQVELRLRGGLFSELLNFPPADSDRLLRQAEQLGCDLRKPQLVALLRFRDQQPMREFSSQPWQRLAQIIAAGSQVSGLPALSADRGTGLALLVEAADPRTAANVIKSAIEQCRRADLPSVVAGVGRVAHDLESFPHAFAEATRAADVAGSSRTGEPIVHFGDLGFHQVVLGARPTEELAAMAEKSIQPLLDSDARRGTDLVPTVRTLLECNGNVEACARKLGLHPNTIRGRITRINQLLGRSIEDHRTRLDLHLALETMLLAGRTT